jgi:phosphate:Na+ symporter
MLAGLILFLFALSFVSDGLRAVSGERMQDWLGRFTRNVFTGILTGVVITTLLDSSSAVIIMTIALVNANALSSRQALGVVLGANIGTTFSSQLIALDIGQWAGLPMAAGFGLMVIFKQEQIVQWGHVLFRLRPFVFGSFFDGRSGGAPQNDATSQGVDGEFSQSGTRGAGRRRGHVLLQSSSATVGMAVVLAGEKMLSLAAGIALMMGAELGTCADTLVASLGRSRAALRTGLFHLVFNLLSITLGLIFIHPFTDLCCGCRGPLRPGVS